MTERKPTRRIALLAAAGAVAALTFGGCNLADEGDDLYAGKQLFIERCGSCHILQRAGTKGIEGPNLDEAFQQARKDGFGESTFESVVESQILYPGRSPQFDPIGGKPGIAMPAKIVTGEDAENVAAYVADAAGKEGPDPNPALARLTVAKPEAKSTEAKDGVLDLPADPTGAFAYQFTDATAPAGPLRIVMENPSSAQHNVAIDGANNAIGEVVGQGGTSTIEVDVQPGEYTLYCSVPGHREGGMETALKVE